MTTHGVTIIEEEIENQYVEAPSGGTVFMIGSLMLKKVAAGVTTYKSIFPQNIKKITGLNSFIEECLAQADDDTSIWGVVGSIIDNLSIYMTNYTIAPVYIYNALGVTVQGSAFDGLEDCHAGVIYDAVDSLNEFYPEFAFVPDLLLIPGEFATGNSTGNISRTQAVMQAYAVTKSKAIQGGFKCMPIFDVSPYGAVTAVAKTLSTDLSKFTDAQEIEMLGSPLQAMLGEVNVGGLVVTDDLDAVTLIEDTDFTLDSALGILTSTGIYGADACGGAGWPIMTTEFDVIAGVTISGGVAIFDWSTISTTTDLTLPAADNTTETGKYYCLEYTVSDNSLVGADADFLTLATIVTVAQNLAIGEDTHKHYFKADATGDIDITATAASATSGTLSISQIRVSECSVMDYFNFLEQSLNIKFYFEQDMLTTIDGAFSEVTPNTRITFTDPDSNVVSAIVKKKFHNNLVQVVDPVIAGATSYTLEICATAASEVSKPVADANCVLCLPTLNVGESMATYLAGEIGRLSTQYGTPHVSPSNKSLPNVVTRIDASWQFDATNEFQDQGMVICKRVPSGFKFWGNYTSVKPAGTGHDQYYNQYINARIFANWLNNTLILNTLDSIDDVMNTRLITNTLTKWGIFFNSLTASGSTVGAKIEYLTSDNPVTDLAAGIIKWRVTYLVAPPAQNPTFIVVVDTSLLGTL